MAQETIHLPDYIEVEQQATRRQRNRWITFSLQGILVLAALAALVPAAFMLMTSLKTNQQYTIDKIGLPVPWVFDNYAEVFTQHPFFLWMANSAILSTGSVAVSTVMAALGAYAIAGMRFRAREFVLALSTSLVAVQPRVRLVPL